MRIGRGTRPWLANPAYAAVIYCSVTSPEPSAREGTLGRSPMPISLAFRTVVGMPTSCRSFTATRLLDVRSPVRRLFAAGTVQVEHTCGSEAPAGGRHSDHCTKSRGDGHW